MCAKGLAMSVGAALLSWFINQSKDLTANIDGLVNQFTQVSYLGIHIVYPNIYGLSRVLFTSRLCQRPHRAPPQERSDLFRRRTQWFPGHGRLKTP